MKNNAWTELVPHLTNCKSFYGKAHVSDVYENGTHVGKLLKSYDTVVAYVADDGTVRRIWSGYSATTMRHIKEFVWQFAGQIMNKKEWDAVEMASGSLYYMAA